MIKSPFTSVGIPDISLHELMLHFFKTNADKKALVSDICFWNILAYVMTYIAQKVSWLDVMNSVTLITPYHLMPVFIECLKIFRFLSVLPGTVKCPYSLSLSF